MACLGSVLYDPGTLATKSAASLLAMTAFDTTNARITFTAPANGIVLARIRVAGKGAATEPALLLGILDGATVRGRQVPIVNRLNLSGSSQLIQHEAAFLVTGLTPGNSYTWDAAYGVELAVASKLLGWGGPDDATTNNAYGALSYEIWDTANLLAGTMYDPGTAASASTASLAALTALDTTNLRLGFTVPASGRVLVRLRCPHYGNATNFPSVHFGVLEGATARGRQCVYNFSSGTESTANLAVCQSEFVVGGLTPAANLTWDAAYAVEVVLASTQLAWGGPNNTTASDAYGGFAYEVWSC